MPRMAFEGLELCDGKLSRTVLRGLGAGNSPRLPGQLISVINLHFSEIEDVGTPPSLNPPNFYIDPFHILQPLGFL